MKKVFSILITTKNRLSDLKCTLNKIEYLLAREDVECIICDDGSEDGTFNFIKAEYPSIILFKNDKSQGLIFSRNRLLEKVSGNYAISIDDDLHFITLNPLEIIENYFRENTKCGLQTFRIFWNIEPPLSTATKQSSEQVNSYAGGAHVYRMTAWNSIPEYPDWFVFYGEESFASFNLFKKGWEIHYNPEILVHHRVNLKARKNNDDYRLRTRRSLRSGWYLFFLFVPLSLIPRKLAYTLWIQIKTKILRGDWRAGIGIAQAIGDVIINFPRLIKENNRLSYKEYREFSKLPEVKLYWQPER